MAQPSRTRPTPPADRAALDRAVRELSAEAREALSLLNSQGRHGLPSFTPPRVLAELEAAGLIDATHGARAARALLRPALLRLLSRRLS